MTASRRSRQIRPIRIVEGIAYISLTKGYEAEVDVADLHLISGFSWRAVLSRNTVYARSDIYAKDCTRAIYMHRVIMGEPADLQVDHRDCNGLNNRRKNLRVATNAQNAHNQQLRADNTSGLKGVVRLKNCARWRARIKFEGQYIDLGCFEKAEDAHAAYCRASKELRGDFARDS